MDPQVFNTTGAGLVYNQRIAAGKTPGSVNYYLDCLNRLKVKKETNNNYPPQWYDNEIQAVKYILTIITNEQQKQKD